MIYLAIILIISLLVSIHLIINAEGKWKSAIVYGTKEDVVKAEKKLDVLFNRCLYFNATLLLINICVMIKPN